jgi:hypothetical protein
VVVWGGGPTFDKQMLGQRSLPVFWTGGAGSLLPYRPWVIDTATLCGSASPKHRLFKEHEGFCYEEDEKESSAVSINSGPGVVMHDAP